jgi:hypothetical protein
MRGDLEGNRDGFRELAEAEKRGTEPASNVSRPREWRKYAIIHALAQTELSRGIRQLFQSFLTSRADRRGPLATPIRT